MFVSIVAKFISCNFSLYFFIEVATQNTPKHCERMEEKLRSIYLATVPGKKDDPNYSAVRGHVPNDVYKKFKIFCLERGVDNSQGLEELLNDYFECKEREASQEKPAKGKRQGKAGESRGAKSE
jgi:hypothetical protein